MVKVQWDDDDIDWKGLSDEDYEDDDFEPYSGPEPPANTLLDGDIKKIWLVDSQAGNKMLKVLFEADGNEGDNAQYDGCPVWDNVVFTSKEAKFRWQPFLDMIGITLLDIKKRTTIEDDEGDNIGLVVEKIGKVSFPCAARIRTGVEKKGEYKGSIRVAKWLPPADADDEEDEDGDDPF